MRIAIDVTPLESGHKHRGTGRYTETLIQSLQQYDINNSYHFFTRTQKIPDNIDLIHYPYFEPFFLTLPFSRSKPIIVTVHDLIPIEFKPHFVIGIRGTIKWNIQRLSLQKARKIITDSEASKKSIEKYTGITSNRIDVVPLAPSDVFTKPLSTSSVKSVREKYMLKRNYIIYVGDVNWNKNILGILKAYEQTISRSHTSLDLVFVGRSFLNQSLQEVYEVNQFIKDHNLSQYIHILGGLSDDDLHALYADAMACILVSFAEGFGLPVLEAMASGCPVITSNTSSLVEIAGPSIHVDPWDISDIAQGIESMIHSDRRKMIMEGKIWVKNYSWKRVAKLTVQSYEKAYHNNSSL